MSIIEKQPKEVFGDDIFLEVNADGSSTHYPASSLGENLAEVLMRIQSQNDIVIRRHDPAMRNSVFYSDFIPTISVIDYIDRVIEYSNVSETCLVAALILIDRVAVSPLTPVVVNSNTLHRLVITAITLAAKLYEDDHYGNDVFCQIGGVSVQELNQLEVEFLRVISFDLHIKASIFLEYSECALRMSVSRRPKVIQVTARSVVNGINNEESSSDDVDVDDGEFSRVSGGSNTTSTLSFVTEREAQRRHTCMGESGSQDEERQRADTTEDAWL